MRKDYQISVKVPHGIACEYSHGTIMLKKGNEELKRNARVPGLHVQVDNGEIKIMIAKTNKRSRAVLDALVAHVKNMIHGLNEKFVYELEICYVHFPMTVKVDGKKLVISNFLGEKVNRQANILEGVDVKIAGQKITVESADVERAGQTAANIEKASAVSNKDRRIFQDGIFITKKPGADL